MFPIGTPSAGGQELIDDNELAQLPIAFDFFYFRSRSVNYTMHSGQLRSYFPGDALKAQNFTGNDEDIVFIWADVPIQNAASCRGEPAAIIY